MLKNLKTADFILYSTYRDIAIYPCAEMRMYMDFISAAKQAETAEKKLFSLLGLAQKAGYVASGEFMTEKAVKEGAAVLVLVAADASENTKKLFRNMCSFYQVPMYIFSEKTKIGHAIGKEFRASLAVKEGGMANAMEKQLKLITETKGENEGSI